MLRPVPCSAFKRAVVLHRPPDAATSSMKAGVAVDLWALIAEILGEDEVQVAVQGMAENDGLVIAVTVRHRCSRSRRWTASARDFDGEGHVLDDHRGAGGLRTAPTAGNSALPDLPQLVPYSAGSVVNSTRFSSGAESVKDGHAPGSICSASIGGQGVGGLAAGFHQQGAVTPLGQARDPSGPACRACPATDRRLRAVQSAPRRRRAAFFRAQARRGSSLRRCRGTAAGRWPCAACSGTVR